MYENVKEMLQNRYNSVSFTDKYILGFSSQNVVYFTICDSSLVDRVTCLDRASRGAGFALRFKPNKAQKNMLLANGCTALCSCEFFNDMVLESKYNRGEVFEKLITEYYGQEWKKDNVPFTEAGDIVVYGTHYQIKFEKATFCNEKSLANLKKM